MYLLDLFVSLTVQIHLIVWKFTVIESVEVIIYYELREFDNQEYSNMNNKVCNSPNCRIYFEVCFDKPGDENCIVHLKSTHHTGVRQLDFVSSGNSTEIHLWEKTSVNALFVKIKIWFNENDLIARFQKTINILDGTPQRIRFIGANIGSIYKYKRITLDLYVKCSKNNTYGPTCIQCIPKPYNYVCDKDTGKKICVLMCGRYEMCIWNTDKNAFICEKISVIDDNCRNTCQYPKICINGNCVCPYPNKMNGDKCTCDTKCKSLLNCTACGDNTECNKETKSCSCKPGYFGNPGIGCRSICKPECKKPAVCVQGICICPFAAYYVNISNEIECVCKPGYKIDEKGNCVGEICKPTCLKGSFCVDGKCKCREPYKEYSQNVGHPQCKCRKGYYEDELLGCRRVKCNQNCDENAICINDKCICLRPYEGDGKTCTENFNCTCKDIKGADCKKGKCICIPPYIEVKRTNSDTGVIKCECKKGFFEDTTTKTCERKCSNKCSNNASCRDNKCTCDKPFEGNGTHCFDCSICKTKQNTFCDYSLFKCSCKEGFSLDKDSGICFSNCKTKCHKEATCIKGHCVCDMKGAQGDGVNHCVNCADCAPEFAECTPTGCRCIDGYNNGDPYFECKVDICIPPFQRDNSTCICPEGYYIDETGKNCLEHTCKTPCHPEAICERGKCKCIDPFYGDGFYCKCKNMEQEQGHNKTCFSNTTKCNNCAKNADCFNNTRCLCHYSFEGNGFEFCFNCRRCGIGAHCVEEFGKWKCACDSAHEGNPYKRCTTIQRSTCSINLILIFCCDILVILIILGRRCYIRTIKNYSKFAMTEMYGDTLAMKKIKTNVNKFRIASSDFSDVQSVATFVPEALPEVAAVGVHPMKYLETNLTSDEATRRTEAPSVMTSIQTAPFSNAPTTRRQSIASKVNMGPRASIATINTALGNFFKKK